jgi:VIT1/CCC1 family predicted Fe2+/Mn2+ transporter
LDSDTVHAMSRPSGASPEHKSSEQDTQLFAEKKRIERLGRIRQLVFGSLDGLLVPLGVISGVAGGTGNSRAVLVAGLAEAFAGALSMGAGEFIAARSEAQVQQTEVARELEAIRTDPAFEQGELIRLLEHEGVATDDATHIVQLLVRYPQAYHKTMMEKELGLQLETDTANVPEALTMGVSYIAGSIFPLAPYFFLTVHAALPISIALTIVALVVVGVIKGKLTSLNLVRSVLEIVLVGAASAGGGYLLGTTIPHVLGF